LNEKGRVLDAASKTALAGLYTSGWIKRGPSGVIGTNKPDSVETATAMADDARAGVVLQPTAATADAALALVAARQPRFVSYEDWKKLDALELANGAAAGRPRVKFTRVDEMLAALGK
jgi:ferredoxin--NADP+ reductase